MSSRPSKSGKDAQRRTAAISDNVSIVWGRVRAFYPDRVRMVVDQIDESGGLTMRDLAAITTAQMLSDLDDGESSQVTSALRLLFRIALVSGGTTDVSSTPVVIPDGLRDVDVTDDPGDDLM